MKLLIVSLDDIIMFHNSKMSKANFLLRIDTLIWRSASDKIIKKVK